MRLISFTSTKDSDLYLNPEHVAIVSPHGQLVSVSNVTLATGLTFEVNGTAHEIRNKLVGVVPASTGPR